ncbi:MAG: PilZ domain-containing protein [Terriglobales bacterium]
MALEALLLSRDPEVQRVLRRVIPDLPAELVAAGTVNDAADKLQRRKFDAVIIDCDDLSGASKLLQWLRHGSSNRSAVVFAIIKESTARSAFELGANFVIDKPLSLERTERSFRAARGLMVRERRRYFRHELRFPVRVETSDGKTLQLVSTNISENGIAVHGPVKLPKDAGVRVSFSLLNGPAIEGKGQVVWSGESGRAGIRLDLPETMQRALNEYLASLFDVKAERIPAASAAGRRSAIA